jgi:hypothetical protein
LATELSLLHIHSEHIETRKVRILKLRTIILVSLAAFGVTLVGAAWFRRRPRRIAITSEDFGYQEHSPEELASEHLVDLSTASRDDLLRLGVNGEMSDRILENRPYRSKLDLLSRMVISEDTYNLIKHQVGIARATESVKIGG